LKTYNQLKASGIEPVALEDPNQGDPNEELPGYFADGNEGLGYGPDASITKVHKGTMYTEGRSIYCTTMAVKRSCVLCTYKEEPAYRLFPSENSEALPYAFER
jgi:hypothetical protein